MNYVLLGALAVLLLRYIWFVYIVKDDEPAPWQSAVREGRAGKALRRMKRSYPDRTRFFVFWIQVERLRSGSVPGDFAELGVYKGQSARVLHRMDPDRVFHLFDTFTGFPSGDLQGETGEAATYTPANFSDTNLQDTLRRIGGNGNIRVYPGYFPGTSAGVEGPFALVNLDADLYAPTRAGLAWFYPRMSPGGVILVHDYNPRWPGLMRAVDEFVATIPEVPVLIPDKEGTLMIIRNKNF